MPETSDEDGKPLKKEQIIENENLSTEKKSLSQNKKKRKNRQQNKKIRQNEANLDQLDKILNPKFPEDLTWPEIGNVAHMPSEQAALQVSLLLLGAQQEKPTRKSQKHKNFKELKPGEKSGNSHNKL